MDGKQQALTAQYRTDMRKNEQGFSDLTKQKKKLEEKKAGLFERKKQMNFYLSNVHNDLRGEDAVQDMRELEAMTAHVQSAFRKMEQAFEQERVEIERSRKKLLSQKEEQESQYRRALADIQGGKSS